jgi:pyruvate dehydrogenase E2 component (dihydrolipoamide acetyltransferase)
MAFTECPEPNWTSTPPSNISRSSARRASVRAPAVAERMRTSERSLEEMEGGTFTITNPGAIGGTSFNPIINHPEVAILAAAQARKTPALSVDGEDLQIRLHLPLVVAFDHRVNDGADAARFMNSIKAYLEDPAELMLHL